MPSLMRGVRLAGKMKRCRTSHGTVVSLGKSARRIRCGPHVEALCEVDGEAGGVLPVPFTQHDIDLWRNANDLSRGVFRSMDAVGEAYRAVEVACYFGDHSTTVKSLAAKLLDACIFEYPGVSKIDTFNLCAERHDILRTVFSSQLIKDSNRMERLMMTIYESLGFAHFARGLFDGSTPDLRSLGTRFQISFCPSEASMEYGIKCNMRGLAAHADVQKKWAALVEASKGFAAERKALLELMCDGSRPIFLTQEDRKMLDSGTSWRCAEKCSGFFGKLWDMKLRSAVQDIAPIRSRVQAAHAFHIAVLSQILDAQVSIAPQRSFSITPKVVVKDYKQAYPKDSTSGRFENVGHYRSTHGRRPAHPEQSAHRV